MPGQLITRQRMFALWALREHDASCPSCRKSERCAAGMRYEAATSNSNDDIPGYRT